MLANKYEKYRDTSLQGDSMEAIHDILVMLVEEEQSNLESKYRKIQKNK